MKVDLDQQRYCIFRCGEDLFGFPALDVGQVATCPELTPVPGCDSVLKGLAHVRNEFLPAFSLRCLTGFDAQNENPEPQLLVVNAVQGNWGLLIDQTLAVAPLEVSFSGLAQSQDQWSKVKAGSASYQENVIQLLEPTALFQFLVERLESHWDETISETCEVLRCV